MQIVALFGVAFLGFLLGGLLMFLLIAGRGGEDPLKRMIRLEAARQHAERGMEAADHVQVSAGDRESALASAAAGSRPAGRVDA